MMMISHTTRRQKMGRIILTGLIHKGHTFKLSYPIINNQKKCIAHCSCGYVTEILYFNTFGGVKYLQLKWEEHVGNL